MAILLIMVAVGFIALLVYISKERNASSQPEKPSESYKPGWSDRKGQEGEEEVGRILARLPREEYIVLNDVLLPTGQGTTQLDHVVVSVYGIFVIESKNYQGKIYGTRSSEKWSQYVDGEEYHFRNPVKQNSGHVMAVKRAAHISDDFIIPLVVFTGSATLKVLDCDEVIYDGMLYETIRSHRNRILSPEQMEYYARIIDERLEENAETKAAHINAVRERVAQWDREVSAGLCPRCDGRLVLRKGKYGTFTGAATIRNANTPKTSRIDKDYVPVAAR